MERKTMLGLVAIVGVWLTAGFALPFVNVLKMFTPEQLLTARGFLTAVMAFALAKGKVMRVDCYTILIGCCLPLASLGLFKGVREWGAGPTIIVITATPVMNFLITFFKGGKVSGVALASLILILGGVVIARYGGTWSSIGFFWSVVGTVFNGVLYEFLAHARSSAFQRCFWGSMGIGITGFVGSYSADWTQVIQSHYLQLALLGFAFVGGLLYWLANLIAFENLPKDAASVLAQGETPAVIAISSFLLGETLTAFQWFGIILAIFGAWYLSRQLAKKEASPSAT